MEIQLYQQFLILRSTYEHKLLLLNSYVVFLFKKKKSGKIMNRTQVEVSINFGITGKCL